MARSVKLELIADASRFTRGMRQAERSTGKFEKSSRRLAGLATGLLGGGAAIAGIKGFVDAARDANQVSAQTSAVIKSTGGAAGLSAKGFSDLAKKLSAYAAVDDDVIQGGENMLATFTKVKAGGPDQVFERASKAAVDMAAAMNHGEVSAEGLQGANLQLGKALNDPLKGITRLQRVGVTFSAQQKEQIEQFVKNGDVAKAQGVIIAEVAKEFGGSAATSATASKRLGVAWGDAQEVLGNLLIPALEKGSVVLTKMIGWMDKNRTATALLAAAIGLLAAAYGVTRVVIAATTKGTVLNTLAMGAAKAATAIWTAAQWLLNAALTANPIGLVVAAIALLVAGLVIAYKKSDTFRKIVDAAFDAVAAAGTWMWEHALKPAFEAIVEAFGKVGGTAKNLWTKVLKPTFRFIVDAWLKVAGWIIEGAADAFGWVPGIGPKLRTAADKFNRFKDRVNGALDNVNDEGVTVKFKSTFTPPKGFSMHDVVGAQRGWRVPGYGGGDRFPAMLEGGEAVVPKHLAASGGFRGWAGAHGIPGFARGGLMPNLGLFSTAATTRTQEGIDQEVARRATAGIARNFRLLLGGGPGIQGALRWARGEEGKPYVWGGVGPGGYDCSGFMSAIANVVQGRAPHRRLFATGSFPTGGWASGYSPLGFSIGSRRGNPGHMAGTLGGVNVESRGSRGVVVGAGARGARDSLFGGNIWNLAGRAGAKPNSKESFTFFDQGGWLRPGATLAVNNTGRSEPVGFDYDRLAQAIAHALRETPPAVYLDRQKVSRAVRNGDLMEARR